MINKTIISTPLGNIGIVTDSAVQAVVGIKYNASEDEFNIKPADITAETAALQLMEYFAGKRRKFELPLLLKGTPFQKSVWTAILNIPYGTTATYSEIALAVGVPKAARAVGNANSNNPIPIIIPCHRVIASNGIGGYTPVISIKKALLQLENIKFRM